MELSASQIKGRIKNIANKNNADPRVLMRIFMMERFLERVSLSKYNENFVIKGGVLVTSMIGTSLRSTMDIDTTIKNWKLDETIARNIVQEIIETKVDDGITFEIKNVETIMDEMEYAGIRVMLDSKIDNMITPIKVDISTGDVITPSAIEYDYKLLLENRSIRLMAYNLETILAEKIQTILVRERANTRMRDFYDVYSLEKVYGNTIDIKTLKAAYEATCKKRNSLELLGNEYVRISNIESYYELHNRWDRYRKKYTYSASIEYQQTIECLKKLIKNICQI